MHLTPNPLLDESLIDVMYTPHGFPGATEPPDAYYGLGIGMIKIDRQDPKRFDVRLGHGGGGFGFTTLMYWYPEYGIGVVALTNRWPHPVCNELTYTVAEKLIEGKIIEKRFQHPWPQCPKGVGPWWGWPGHHIPTPYKSKWRKYCSAYCFRFSGYKFKWYAKLVLALGIESWTPGLKIHQKDGFLCVTESEFFQQFTILRAVNDKLFEVKPGLFVTAGGTMLDFTGEVPTWCNWRLKQR